MNKKRLLTLTATGLGIALAAGATSASAQEGSATDTTSDTVVEDTVKRGFGLRHMQKPQITDEQKQTIIDAIAANDYDSWVTAIEEARPSALLENAPEHMVEKMEERIAESTSEEHFNEIVAVYEESGEDGLQELREEEREEHMGERGRIGKGSHGMKGEHREEMVEYFENDDYEGWSTFMAEELEEKGIDQEKIDDITSEESFESHSEAHELMESGDRAAAHELMQELHPDRPDFKGHGGQQHQK